MTTTFPNISDDQLDVPVPTMNEIVAALAGELMSAAVRESLSGRCRVDVSFLPYWPVMLKIRYVADKKLGGHFGAFRMKVDLTADDAAEVLVGLIKRVEALGEVS